MAFASLKMRGLSAPEGGRRVPEHSQEGAPMRAGRPQVAADGRNPHLGLPDPVLKNMGPPIKYGFQTNEGYFFIMIGEICSPN
jgi:hypothetical protein